MQQASEVLRQLTQWAEGQPLVRAAILTSTRARPNAAVDVLSDYDVILAVSDVRPFYQDRRWLQDFGQVLVVYWDPMDVAETPGFEVTGNVTQYEDGLKIDFSLWPVELLQRIVEEPVLPDELDAGYAILVDKDSLAAGMKTPTYSAYIPSRPDGATYQKVVEEFFSDAPYVAKCLWRDELLPAKWCLDYDMKHVYLRQMLEWRVELDHDWSMPVGALGKGLKKHVSPAIWAQLEETYVGAGLAENWAALFKTIALYRKVACEVAEQLGYVYPHELDRRVTAYVQQIQQMDRQTDSLA